MVAHAAKAAVSCVPDATYLEGKCQGVCRRRRVKHAGRKLEMRPEHSGTDLYQRVSKVHRQAYWLPGRPLGLMIVSVLL